MAITFPREIPNLSDVAQILKRQKTVVGVFEGTFSGIQKVQKHPFQRWEIEYTIIPLNRERMDEWWAWIISLNGREKTFYAGIQAPNEIKGAAKNYTAPELNGAHDIRTNTLSINAAQPSITNYFKYGDVIQLGTGTDSRLYMVLENVDTNGAGEASFNIWPDLQADYIDNTTVTVTSPKGVFRMVSNEPEIIQDGTSTIKGLRFGAIGVI